MRIYANSEEIPKVLNGLGIAIISTQMVYSLISKQRQIKLVEK